MEGEFYDRKKLARLERLEGHMYRILKRRADAAGVTQDEETAARMTTYEKGGPENWFPELVNQMERLIAEKGGSAGADVEPALKKLIEALEENNRLLRVRKGPAGAPPPLPGPPPGGPMRGG